MKVTCGNCHRELQIPQCLPSTMLMCPHCKEWTPVPTSSADQWFVARNKQKLGPFSLEQLKQQASVGKLQPADMLLKEGTAKWIAASVAGDLFPTASAQVRLPATIGNSTKAPAGRKKRPVSIAVIAVQATVITALLIGIPAAFISVIDYLKSSQNIEEIKAGAQGRQKAFDETRKREGYSGDKNPWNDTKPDRKPDLHPNNDRDVEPPDRKPDLHPNKDNVEPPAKTAAIPPDKDKVVAGTSIMLSTKNEVEDFADNTSSYKGKTITLALAIYFPSPVKTLREGLPDTRKFWGVASDLLTTIDVKIKIESDDGLPNAKFADQLVITFLCGEGDLKKGNKLISAKRK